MLSVRNCVRVARQTLTLFVWVRILVPQPSAPINSGLFLNRGVAQFGSAHRSGRWSRKFESCHLDQNINGQYLLVLSVFIFAQNKRERNFRSLYAVEFLLIRINTVIALVIAFRGHCIISEQQRYAPYCTKTYYYKNNSADG